MNLLPVLMIFVPVLAALLIPLGLFSPRRVSLWAGGINLIIALKMYWMYQLDVGGYQFVTRIPLSGVHAFFPISLHFGVDGISLPLVLLTAIVTLAAVAVSSENIRRAKEFYIYLLLISAGAIGAFTALDLFFFYGFHEVALIPTFLMIGIWGSHDRKTVATQITLYLSAGSLVLLIGLLLFYFHAPTHPPTFDLVDLQQQLGAGSIPLASSQAIFLLLLIGFGTLVSLWPFHNWAAPAYRSAPPSVAMMHAGVLKKFGIYGLLRLAEPFLPQMHGAGSYLNLLLILLVFNVVWIGYVTIAQKDLGLMLGFSSVMHMGYLFLGIAAGLSFFREPQAIIPLTGVVLLMVGHGLSTALLFALSGEIRQRLGTLNMTEIGGLASKTPQLVLLFVIGALASIGVPGFANFTGEILIFFGSWHASPCPTVFCIFGLIISAIYMLRAVRNVFYAEPSQLVASKEIKDVTVIWPYLLLIVPLLTIGFWPKTITAMAQPSIERLLGL